MAENGVVKTSILPVNVSNIGRLTAKPDETTPDDFLWTLDIDLSSSTPDAQNFRHAAEQLRTSDVPVAFPTETVYGLGADATRSKAVLGIFRAKGRPADNPLIVHFASLRQLRKTLRPNESIPASSNDDDPIPSIYRPLIERFWPGPMTIILSNPEDSQLAPEVTAGLKTFGARMPRHPLALALIQTANVPVAAPSANASTKPSPTAAEHVAYDLDGRIETIIDGGPCDVGVESTVVDGLSQPPLVLRPGGISIEQIRACPGWEDVQIGYKNVAELGSQPKAPGMKYRHYSPKATVVLYEKGKSPPGMHDFEKFSRAEGRVGIITTKRWRIESETAQVVLRSPEEVNGYHNDAPNGTTTHSATSKSGFVGMLETLQSSPNPRAALNAYDLHHNGVKSHLLEIPLGADTAAIARGTFAALRELDRQDVQVIFVEGIDDREGDTAAAVMNRLRKAAEIKIAD